MTVTDAIKTRRSIRKYKEGAVISDEQVKLLLEAAMMAPSAGNGRPWEFVVVRDRGKLDEIVAVHPYSKMLATASACIVVCGLPEASVLAKDYFPQDCAAATMNILLQAVSMGLATCWCGVYPVPERVESIRQVLGVDSVPFNLIAIGEPDEKPEARGYYDQLKVSYI